MNGRKRHSNPLAGARRNGDKGHRPILSFDLWFAAPVVFFSGALPQVQAQSETEADSAVLEEVIVTARKREESLQDTPISITACSGSRLEAANYTRLDARSAALRGIFSARSERIAAPFIFEYY